MASKARLIDALRGVAALSVVAVHTPHWPGGPLLSHPFGLAGFLIDFGRQGVPLFIVISGYCIHHATRGSWASTEKVHVSWSSFFRRRLRRLYVPYLGAIALGLLSLWFITGHDTVLKRLPFDVPIHLLMLQNTLGWPAGGVGNGPLWTIGLEIQLYLLYPLVFCTSQRLGWRITLLAVLTITVLWAVFVPELPARAFGSWTVTFAHPEMWAFEYWFIWCLGAYTCELVAAEFKFPVLWGNVLLFSFLLLGMLTDHRTMFVLENSAIAMQIFWPWLDFLSWLGSRVVHSVSVLSFGTAFSLVIVLGQQLEKSGKLIAQRFLKPLSLVGLISYSLYLTHIPVLVIWRNLVPNTTDNTSVLPWILRYVIDFPVCLLFAAAYFVFVERHFLRQRKATPSQLPAA